MKKTANNKLLANKRSKWMEPLTFTFRSKGKSVLMRNVISGQLFLLLWCLMVLHVHYRRLVYLA